jgi:microcystin-dependent protein
MLPEKISQLPINSSPALSDYLPELNTVFGQTNRITLSSLSTLFASQFLPSGIITEYGGRVAPTGWVLCFGQAISRTSFANLFNALVPSIGTFTVTIATPAVVTLAGHGFVTGDAVYLTTTGALPTGLTANTIYYVVAINSSTFNLATTAANAYAGTKINTTGTQSGTHTCFACPYGLGDGATTFNTPDMRGRVPAGADAMGGTAANRLSLAQTQGTYGNLGANGGEQGHQITIAELASHTHTYNFNNTIGGIAAGGGIGQNTPALNTSSTGSDTAHNNVQPTLVTNFIVKT